jgi:hypothetical protein
MLHCGDNCHHARAEHPSFWTECFPGERTSEGAGGPAFEGARSVGRRKSQRRLAAIPQCAGNIPKFFAAEKGNRRQRIAYLTVPPVNGGASSRGSSQGTIGGQHGGGSILRLGLVNREISPAVALGRETETFPPKYVGTLLRPCDYRVQS